MLSSKLFRGCLVFLIAVGVGAASETPCVSGLFLVSWIQLLTGQCLLSGSITKNGG